MYRTNEAESAFEHAKEAIANSVTLPHMQKALTSLQLMTDASQTAIGAALHDSSRETAKPIAFFSKKLSATQTCYSTFDRELLAAYLAVVLSPLSPIEHKTPPDASSTVFFTILTICSGSPISRWQWVISRNASSTENTSTSGVSMVRASIMLEDTSA